MYCTGPEVRQGQSPDGLYTLNTGEVHYDAAYLIEGISSNHNIFNVLTMSTASVDKCHMINDGQLFILTDEVGSLRLWGICVGNGKNL